MPAPATLDAFLEVLNKSGLVGAERLQLFMQLVGDVKTPRKLVARLIGSGLLTHFQAEQLLLGKYRGYTIGKYRVLERIGAGGHSTVYLCEHMMVKRRVAIKVLPTAKADNPAALARFYREARATGALDHPNLVKAHDIDQDNGLHFLVMDYIDGSSLQEIVSRSGPLSIARAVYYIEQAAHGLEAAHAAGLVHRDIKPGNILLDRRGNIRVLDLGLARFFSDKDDSLTLMYDDKNVLGTADYVAPEQALNSHNVDIRADIYSLGATFYFLLTGQPLFPDGKIAQKLIWHQMRQPTPLQQLRAEVPADLTAIIDRMLHKKPDQRFSTPSEVIEALTPWITTPVPPPPEEEMPRLSPAARAAVAGDSGSNLSRGARSGGVSTPSLASFSLPEWPAPLAPKTANRVAQPTLRPASMVELRTTPILAAEIDTGHEETVRSLPVAGPVQEPAAIPCTAPSAAPAARRPSQPANKRRVLTAVLFITTAVVTGVGIRWLLSRPTPKGETLPSAPAARIVSHSPGNYPSLAAALRDAPPGAHILVCEPTWEEALQFTGDGSATHAVHIEGKSPTGAAVYWRPPRGHRADQPLVQISEGTSVTLKGFTLDGEDRVKDLVSLAGPCAGLKLEDLHLQRFQQNGVVLRHCTGTGNQPVRLQGLSITPARSATSALLFEANSGESNRHICVIDCRLEGPYRSSVCFHGPATDIELQRNRLFNATDGVLYARTTPTAPLELALISNTFCALEKFGVHFETLPPVDRSRITFTNNLFARTGTLAHVDDFAPQPTHTRARWIWSADKRPRGQRPEGTPVEKRYFRKSFRVADSAAVQAVLNITGDASFTAWLNGDRIGHGELESLTQIGHGIFRTSTRRVYSFDVTRYLRPGENVLAVEGSETMGTAGILAELTYACPGSTPVTVVSDATWKTFRETIPNWQQPGWNETAGQDAAVVAAYGDGPAGWRNLVWDSVLQEKFQGRTEQLFPVPSGNVRDWTTVEGFPLLRSVAYNFELPTDANDDAHFLRYPSTSLLKLAGAPGVPPIEKKPGR